MQQVYKVLLIRLNLHNITYNDFVTLDCVQISPHWMDSSFRLYSPITTGRCSSFILIVKKTYLQNV